MLNSNSFMKALEKRYDLGFFPTPLHPLKNLSERYPEYEIFIKRDDQTGLASGGNKTRKLEYLIYEALQNNCDTVITAGAQQSNHCRQTAAACSVAGKECHLLLGGEEPEDYNGNLLLSHLLGASLHFAGEHRKGEDIPVLKQDLEKEGKKVYVVPYGGSNLVGAMGYINAVKELKQQIDDLKTEIDYIFFASSSGATQAGIMVGMDLYGLNAELIPVNIDKAEIEGTTVEKIILDLIKQSEKFFSLKKKYTLKGIPLNRDYDAPGYGVITKGEKDAVKILASAEGILLDPVYTGRAFFGMLDILEKRKLRPGSKILFWHTGGLPANYYYRKELK